MYYSMQGMYYSMQVRFTAWEAILGSMNSPKMLHNVMYSVMHIVMHSVTHIVMHSVLSPCSSHAVIIIVHPRVVGHAS